MITLTQLSVDALYGHDHCRIDLKKGEDKKFPQAWFYELLINGNSVVSAVFDKEITLDNIDLCVIEILNDHYEVVK